MWHCIVFLKALTMAERDQETLYQSAACIKRKRAGVLCAVVGSGAMQVLHAVIYPNLDYDVPILSMDMVGKGNQVSLCIIDPCPVRTDRTVPAFFRDITLCASLPAGSYRLMRTLSGGKCTMLPMSNLQPLAQPAISNVPPHCVDFLSLYVTGPGPPSVSLLVPTLHATSKARASSEFGNLSLYTPMLGR